MVTPKKAMAALAVAIIGMAGLAACSSSSGAVSSNITIGEYSVPSDFVEALDRVLDNKDSMELVTIMYKKPTGERYLCIYSTDTTTCQPIDAGNGYYSMMKSMDSYGSGQEWFLDMAKSANLNAFDDMQDALDYMVVIGVNDDSCYIHTGNLSLKDKDIIDQNRQKCHGDFFG